MIENMTNAAVEIAANVCSLRVIVALSVVCVCLTAYIGKNKHLENINAAKDELKDAAIQTVGELNQLFVSACKETQGGKLTEEQVVKLGAELVNLTLKKMSGSAIKVLEAASIDLETYIHGAAEDWIGTLKGNGVEVGVITGIK